MNWVQLGGSLAAILALAGLARWLKLGESHIADVATARRFAEEALTGFTARDAVVATGGNAAVVAGSDRSGGALAVVKRHGSHVAVRRLVAPLDVRETVEGAIVETGERMFGPVTLFGVLPADIRALEAATGPSGPTLH